MTTRPKPPATDKRPASSWRYEEGILIVRHRGEKISLGRFATRDHAAKAAAVYFAKHGGQQ
jgi:hypothetical protein